MIWNSRNGRAQSFHSDLKEDSLSVCLSICWTQIRSLLSLALITFITAEWLIIISTDCPLSLFRHLIVLLRLLFFSFFVLNVLGPLCSCPSQLTFSCVRQQTNAYKELWCTCTDTSSLKSTHKRFPESSTHATCWLQYSACTCYNMARTHSTITPIVTNIQEPKHTIKQIIHRLC